MIDATKDKLIVALDLPAYDEARALVDRLGDAVNFYKIGLELLLAGGLELARELKFDGKRVFLDLKFLDIGNTVERAVAAAAGLGVDFLTVHGHDTKTLNAAVRGRAASNLKLLGRHRFDKSRANRSRRARYFADARAVGAPPRKTGQRLQASMALSLQVRRRAQFAPSSGPQFLIVTPGIRLAGADSGDQSRVTTPEDALRAGADHLVVGRPINAAKDPRAAAEAFLARIAEA